MLNRPILLHLLLSLLGDCLLTLMLCLVWLLGGTTFNCWQLMSITTASFNALCGSRSKGTVVRRSRSVYHCLGPAPHISNPACIVLYGCLQQHLRSVLSGRLEVVTWNTDTLLQTLLFSGLVSRYAAPCTSSVSHGPVLLLGRML